ncbi:MAG: YggS family pyridoxal phosphate-dependent enzyme [Marmoricola sp.]
MSATTPLTGRRQELAANLAAVRERIARATDAAGRTDEVGLVVVTKFFPETDVRLLADLGVTDVGENRHQEGGAKAAACADLGLRWHFIGGLQSNKAAAVAHWADVVQSVDRAKLLAGLSRGAQERAAGQELEVLVQVALDPPGASGRSGAEPADVAALADAVEQAPGLRLGGVMGVAPLGADPLPAFEELARIGARLRSTHPRATTVSAGMSGDLEAAISSGATHVRVGSAILGKRPAIK